MMKFSTRARYGLRMMVELARELETNDLVHLKRIARITGLSENYMAQLAMSLKNAGLIIGISGQNGGYHLTRRPDKIKIGQIVQAVSGAVSLSDCVGNPDICMNSGSCEARLIWVILSGAFSEILNKYTLADLIDTDRLAGLCREYAHLPLLHPDNITVENVDSDIRPCASPTRDQSKELQE